GAADACRHESGAGAIAPRELDRERTRDGGGATARREPDDGNYRTDVRSWLGGVRPRRRGLEQPALGARHRDGEEAGVATRVRDRVHRARTAACARTSSSRASAASAEGGRIRTSIRPPLTLMRILARDQPGTAARAAAVASPPSATASAAASAALPARTAE